MSKQRRDNKNRILRQGESQRKDGRYCYKYTDDNGRVTFLYSWKLTDSDIAPKGKKDNMSLRSQIEELHREQLLYGGITKKKLVVGDLLDMLIKEKARKNRPSTIRYKEYIIRTIKEETKFCNTPINKITVASAKRILDNIQDKHHYSGITSRAIKGTLRSSFDIAVENEWTHKNPFDFRYNVDITKTYSLKDGLSESEYESFMSYVKHHQKYSKYYDIFNILFETGMRVSELAGLTRKDIDFDKGIIKIDKQLLYIHATLYIGETKTKNANRFIPITEKARPSLQKLVEESSNYENHIDGYSGFIVLNSKHRPYHNYGIEQIFKKVRENYSRDTGIQCSITPHICRHTFCSRMVVRGMNPRILQSIMGHSDLRITYNVYTTIQPQDTVDELKRLSYL